MIVHTCVQAVHHGIFVVDIFDLEVEAGAASFVSFKSYPEFAAHVYMAASAMLHVSCLVVFAACLWLIGSC